MRTPVFEKSVKQDNCHFRQHQTTSLRRALTYSLVPYNTIHSIPKSWSHVLLQHKGSTGIPPTRMCSTNCILAIICKQYVLRFWSLSSDHFFWLMCLSHLKICQHSEHACLRQQKPKNDSIIWTKQWKVTICFAEHTIEVVVLFEFQNQTVIKVENYQILSTGVQSEAQQVPQKAVFQNDKSSSQYTCAVHFLSDKMFPNS